MLRRKQNEERALVGKGLLPREGKGVFLEAVLIPEARMTRMTTV